MEQKEPLPRCNSLPHELPTAKASSLRHWDMDKSETSGEKPAVRIVLRPYASPIPLAALAFGTGNVLYSAFSLHWIPTAEAHLVAFILLAFVAPLELGPSCLAFLTRDAGGATAFAIFGASWIVSGFELLTAPTQVVSPAAGIFLLCLALCLLMLAVVSFKGKPLLGGVLVLAILRTVGAAAVSFTGGHFVATATAYCGLLLAASAFYSAFAFLNEDVTQKVSRLTFRTGEAKRAMEGRLEDQIDTLEKEAGVRKQL